MRGVPATIPFPASAPVSNTVASVQIVGFTGGKKGVVKVETCGTDQAFQEAFCGREGFFENSLASRRSSR